MTSIYTRFERGSKVLCNYSGGEGCWKYGIVHIVGYTVEEDDALPAFVNAGDEVPYQVRLMIGESHDRYIYVPNDDDATIMAFNADNMASVQVESEVLERYMKPIINKDSNEACRLLRLSVKRRNKSSAEFIANVAKIPLKAIGPELVRLAVHCEEEYIVKGVDSEEEEQLYYQQLKVLMDWLGEAANTRVDCLRNSQGHHAEHIASINGDIILLLWLLKDEYSYSRNPSFRTRSKYEVENDLNSSVPRDNRGNTPLHYASIHNNVQIIRMYIESKKYFMSFGENSWFNSISDYDALNIDGKCALDLSSDNETQLSLTELQKQIYQGKLNSALQTEKALTNDEFDQLQNSIDEYGLDLQLAISETGLSGGTDNVVKSLEDGNLGKIKWLFKALKVIDLSWTDPDDASLDLMHVACRRGKSSRRSMEEEADRVEEENSPSFKHYEESLREMFLFMEMDWSGNANIIDEGEKFVSGLGPSSFRLRLSSYREEITQSSASNRIELINWLIRKDIPIPDCNFIVEQCNYCVAKYLLGYRLQIDRIVDDLFLDPAPEAMGLIKEFLYRDRADALQTPFSIAMLCLKPPAIDRLNVTDASRLLLLNMIITRGRVNPLLARKKDGISLLHEAVRNKQVLIATWLARAYPKLAHIRGSVSGKLPIHLALDLVEDGDSHLDKVLVKFMMCYAGEARSYDSWAGDNRVWSLDDIRGRTVRDYAFDSPIKNVREAAREPSCDIAYKQMVDMVTESSVTVASLNTYCEEKYLVDHIRQEHDATDKRFLYSCICSGRLDVLKWYQETLRRNSSTDVAVNLGSSDILSIHFPRVYCTPLETFSVGERLEVLSDVRNPKIPLSEKNYFDGVWELRGWKLYSDGAALVRIEDLVLHTAEVGLDKSTIEIENGLVVLRVQHDRHEEIWYSHSSCTDKGTSDSKILELRRRNKRESDGYIFWAETDRTLTLRKLDQLDKKSENQLNWCSAKVIDATETDLKISYEKLESRSEEWIPKSSERINRSGSYKDWYPSHYSYMFQKEDENLISGRELAGRYSHDNIQQWIDSATGPKNMKDKLQKMNFTFVKAFFSECTNEEIEDILREARDLAYSPDVIPNCQKIVKDLEGKFYVLDKCWATQPPVKYFVPLDLSDKYYHENRNELERLGILRCMAKIGHTLRVNWIINRQQNFDPDSDQAIGALFDAAERNHVEVMKELISHGVQTSASFSINAHKSDDYLFLHERDKSLIEVAVSNLSGNVVCYLVDNNHIPRNNFCDELLFYAVNQNFVYGKKKNIEGRRKAEDRLVILKKLESKYSDVSSVKGHRSLIEEAVSALRMMLLRPGDIDGVPITQELISWLCSKGCDLAAAVERTNWIMRGAVKPDPEWLKELLDLAKSTWPLSDAVSRGAATDELESLVCQNNIDIPSVKDQSGRTLIQIAIATDQITTLEWLVKKKNANIDEKDSNGETPLDLATKLGLKDMVKQIQWLKKWSKRQRKIEASRIKKENRMATVIETCVRRYLAQKQFQQLKQNSTLGVWAEVVSLVYHFEARDNKPSEYFGKSWVELRDFVVEEDLIPEIDGAATQHEGEEDSDKIEELAAASLTFSIAKKESDEQRTKVNNIQMADGALRWLRKQKDEKYRAIFKKRIERLANGDRSYCISKRLRGSSRFVTETKLDAGKRIIWTQRGNGILVWFICHHKHIDRCKNLVEQSYERTIENMNTNSSTSDTIVNDEETHPEVLVDPASNTPLKIHSIQTADLYRLVEEASWVPPVKLTQQEEDIVKREGTVLILGRSGTGKTLCVSSRMSLDRQLYGGKLRQLFLARTQRLCDLVKSLQAGEDLSSSKFMKMQHLIQEVDEIVEGKRWIASKFVDYGRFCEYIWKDIRGNEQELDTLQVWLQFRSFIKGSFEAANKNQPLTESEYVHDLSKDRCRLDMKMRSKAYKVFLRYQDVMKRNGWWDEMDRTMAVVSMFKSNTEALYDKIYVDEVQDMTQAEIGLLILLVGGRCDSLFLAGDTAQAVEHGVDFRFEEVRSVVHMISGGLQRVERWEKLYQNFRSHQGILRASNFVLRTLHYAFPNAAAKLPFDKGLVQGPRPGILMAADINAVANILSNNQRLRILVRDEHKPKVQDRLPSELKHSVFGIREAKGLEFSDLIILDYFASAHDSSKHKAWKQLLLDVNTYESVSDEKQKVKMPNLHTSIPLTMELELKLLYTAITRSCNRLFFVETSSTQGFDAWCRSLQQQDLAVRMDINVLTANVLHQSKQVIMTSDDWRAEGVDLASLAEDNINEGDGSNALESLEKAIICFQSANDLTLETRARSHLKAAKSKLLLMQQLGDEKDVTSGNSAAVHAVIEYLNAGMPQEAACLCELYCLLPQLQGLGKRIRQLK